MKNVLEYTHDMFEEDVQVFKQAYRSYGCDHIVTLYRGGLPLGVRLSNELNCPLSIIDYQSYAGKKTEHMSLIKDDGIKSKDVILLVDDICDSGNTMKKAIDFLHENTKDIKIIPFTIFGSKDRDCHFCRENSEQWVQFLPWEGPC